MLFNSIEFIIFLPIVFILYWFIFNKNYRLQNILLLVASYFFYGWWSWKFLGLLATITILDYYYGFFVASKNRKKAKFFLRLSLINNLGILGIFKYFNFFITQFQELLDMIGLNTNPLILELALPIGISFYTFHGMSYVFDIYNGKQKPIANIIDYAVFVSYFPLLVAGPIERANHLLPQIQKSRNFNYNQAVEGCRLILWGLFKKVVIADNLAEIVNENFETFNDQNAYTLILTSIAFSFQIYGDFSGYSDIAMGTSKLFGIELLSNFRFPYFSRDVSEFWRRWHISLSSWFRDYLYIPLGGSKEGKLISIRNTFIIFLVSGFWHGASWNFIIWGALHALGFIPLMIFNRNRKYVNDTVAQNRNIPSFKELTQIITTFAFVTFAWIFFRSIDINSAFGFIKQIALSTIYNPKQFLQFPEIELAFLSIFPLIIGDWYLRRNERILRTFSNTILRYVIYIILSSLVIIEFLEYFKSKPSSFIYFEF